MPASTNGPSIEQLLDSEVEALDRVVAEVRSGFRDQRHFDELEDSTARIANNLRAIFRGRVKW